MEVTRADAGLLRMTQIHTQTAYINNCRVRCQLANSEKSKKVRGGGVSFLKIHEANIGISYLKITNSEFLYTPDTPRCVVPCGPSYLGYGLLHNDSRFGRDAFIYKSEL